MVATLTKNGTGCSIGDNRAYDAWGNIVSGAGSGDPKGRYCANLGHKQDDESGLTYMRARYYEGTSGRFVSEDPGSAGVNLFTYCGNSPTNYVDENGKIDGADLMALWSAIKTLLSGLGIELVKDFGRLLVLFGAQVIGLAMMGLGHAICNVGAVLTNWAEAMARSDDLGWAASAVGYCGARALAAGLMLDEIGFALLYLGEGADGLDDDDGGGNIIPDPAPVDSGPGSGAYMG